jgi:hypothetical protein
MIKIRRDSQAAPSHHAETTKVASVDAASLAGQASRCRRLAAGIGDGDTKVTLLALAVEYELRADQMAGE